MNLNDLYEQYRKKPCEISLSEVLKESQNLIYGIIVKVANHDHDSEDLTQEVLIKVIQNINILPKDTNYGGWLNRTSLNTAINFYHQKQRIKTLAPKLQDLKKNQNGESAEETIAIIYQHLSQLESTEESLILSKYIHQMTYAQMSSIYQLPKSTIESKINNILGKLKVSIEKAGFAGVALAITSTLGQLKATELATDLIPKIKEHFPIAYPKVKTLAFSAKALLKIAVTIVAISTAYFTFDLLVSSNQVKNQPSIELAKNQKLSKEDVNEKISIEKNEENKIHDSLALDQKPDKDLGLTSKTKEDQKTSIVKDFAGQLIDYETKKPVAGAKLEIWDIYSFKKIMAETDIEGKYFVPKELNISSYYFLKFKKENYAVKQTFQNFEIHKNLKLMIQAGTKFEIQININNPTNGSIYTVEYLNLKNEIHLSEYQKEIFKSYFEKINVYENIDFCCTTSMGLTNLKEVVYSGRVENIDNFTLFFIDEDSYSYKGHWIDGRTGKSILDKQWDLNNIEKNRSKIYLADTKQLVTNNRYLYNSSVNSTSREVNVDNDGLISNIIGASFLTEKYLKDEHGNYFYLNGRMPSNTDIENEIMNYSLTPYLQIKTDDFYKFPEFLNAVIVINGYIFNKETKLKLMKKNCWENTLMQLDIYDQYLLKKLYSFNIKAKEIVDLYEEFNNYKLSNSSSIKILASINGIPLSNKNLTIFKENGEIISNNFLINSSGEGELLYPSNVKTIIVEYKVTKDLVLNRFVKRFELSKIGSNVLKFCFDKAVKIDFRKTEYEKMENFYKEFNKIEKRTFHGINGAQDYVRVRYFSFKGKETLISFVNPINFNGPYDTYVEKGEDYFFESDCSGVKTLQNQIIQCRTINFYQNDSQVAVIVPTELDFCSFHMSVVGLKPNDNDKLVWSIESCDQFEKYSKNYSVYKIFPEEFDVKGLYNSYSNSLSARISIESYNQNKCELLHNRSYILSVSCPKYVSIIKKFNISSQSSYLENIEMIESNSVIVNSMQNNQPKSEKSSLTVGDVIYKYDGSRIKNKDELQKIIKECAKDFVKIEVLKNNLLQEIIIEKSQSISVDNYWAEDISKK